MREMKSMSSDSKSGGSPGRKKIALFFVVLCLLLSACNSRADNRSADLYLSAGTSGPANYRTAVAIRGDLVRTVSIEIEPVYSTKVTLYCPADGVRCEPLVKTAEKVTEGQALAEFYYDISFADLEEKRLALERAREQYETQRETLEELSGRSNELALMELELSSARNIAALENEYEKIKSLYEGPELLLAPFDGVINSVPSRNVSGQTVNAGTALITLSKLDTMVLMSTNSSSFFTYGLPVTIEYGKPGDKKTVTGRVSSTDSVMSELPPLNATYVTPDSPIPLDELVNIKATTTLLYAKDAVIVPLSAVSNDSGRHFVSILDVDGNVHKRYVTRGATGGETGAFLVEIVAGLEAGQTVVLP